METDNVPKHKCDILKGECSPKGVDNRHAPPKKFMCGDCGIASDYLKARANDLISDGGDGFRFYKLWESRDDQIGIKVYVPDCQICQGWEIPYTVSVERGSVEEWTDLVPGQAESRIIQRWLRKLSNREFLRGL